MLRLRFKKGSCQFTLDVKKTTTTIHTASVLRHMRGIRIRVTKRVNNVGYLGVPVLMLKLGHNLRWQASALLYFWYTICVAGMVCDILSKDNISTSWNDEQAAPPDYSHHQSRKQSYFSEHSMTIKSANNSLRLCLITLTWKFMTYTLW